MKSTETHIVDDIRLAIGKLRDVRMFRFQCGEFETAWGGYITVGIPGMSDLLGWRTLQITPAMVGLYVPVFTAIEVKKKKAKTEKKRLELQKSWLATVKSHGGLAGFATDEQEAIDVLQQAPGVICLP